MLHFTVAAIAIAGGAVAYAHPGATMQPANDSQLFVTPISEPLGLADALLRAPRGATSAELIIDPQGAAVHVPMLPGTGGFVARIMTGRGEVTLATTWTDGAGTAHTTPGVLFRIRPKFETPDWAKGAVWYQVFPERFRNANSANDPNGKDVYPAGWQSDWYTPGPGEVDAWKKRNPGSRHEPDLYRMIYDRRYGGDLQGLVEKLPYLADLGVTAIYLNPIFQARSLHKYDASDYRHIDDALGNPAGPSFPIADDPYSPPPGETANPATWTWTPADRYFVETVLPAVKRRGLRLILDGVWNHTGTDFWAFQDMRAHGKLSPYAPWYIASFDDHGKLTGWSGWGNRPNGTLPEFRQVAGEGLDPQHTVEKGDLNAGVKAHIFDVTRRWMDPDADTSPADGIDGWRLDVAGEIGSRFWKDWAAHVRSINPQALLVAEVWDHAPALTSGGQFDAQMNYPFAAPVIEWLTNADHAGAPVTPESLGARLRSAFDGQAPQTRLVEQNLYDSHDTDRLASMLFNPGRRYNDHNRGQNSDDKPGRDRTPYKPGKPDTHAYALVRLAVAIQATYEGAPMVYYGDEYGMWGANDPTCRKPMAWPDLAGQWPADEAPMTEIREEYRRWLRLRSEGACASVLRYGDTRHLSSGSPDVFAFERFLNDRRVLVVVNRGDSPFNAGPLGADAARPVEATSAAAWLIVPDKAPELVGTTVR